MQPNKILQIIPAPVSMKAWYEDPDTGKVFSCPIVCLALMENDYGSRYIQPMGMTLRNGVIDGVNGYGEELYFSIEKEFPEEAGT